MLKAFYIPDPVHPALTPAHAEWMRRLVESDLMCYAIDAEFASGFLITPRGRAHIQQITALKLPEQRMCFIGHDGAVIHE